MRLGVRGVRVRKMTVRGRPGGFSGFRAPSGRRGSRPAGAPAPVLGMTQTLQLAKQEFARARRYEYPLTLAVCRIDRIESLSDLYGQDSHDLLQDQLVQTFQKRSRSTDLTGRWNESRLLWVLPHTGLDGALIAAERIRAAVEELEILSGSRRIRVTLSVGLACFVERNTLFFDSVLMMAEEALTLAQRLGGNRIEVLTPKSSGSEGKEEEPEETASVGDSEPVSPEDGRGDADDPTR